MHSMAASTRAISFFIGFSSLYYGLNHSCIEYNDYDTASFV